MPSFPHSRAEASILNPPFLFLHSGTILIPEVVLPSDSLYPKLALIQFVVLDRQVLKPNSSKPFIYLLTYGRWIIELCRQKRFQDEAARKSACVIWKRNFGNGGNAGSGMRVGPE